MRIVGPAPAHKITSYKLSRPAPGALRSRVKISFQISAAGEAHALRMHGDAAHMSFHGTVVSASSQRILFALADRRPFAVSVQRLDPASRARPRAGLKLWIHLSYSRRDKFSARLTRLALRPPVVVPPATTTPPPVAATAQLPLRKTPFAFNEDWLSHPDLAAPAAQMGATVARVPLWWTLIESTPGQFDWSPYDKAAAQMRAHGIRPIWVVQYAPCWTRPATPCQPGLDGGGQAPARDHDWAWARFLTALAAHYPETLAIEVWNEPNLELYFHHPDPARYTELLKAADLALAPGNPNLPVIFAGLAPDGHSGDFLEAAYAAGARGHFDGLAVHPYPQTRVDPVGRMRVLLDESRSIRNRHGDGAIPLWITEIGVTTSGPDASTEAEQSQALMGMIDALARMPDVAVIGVHRVGDVDLGATDGESGFGVLRLDGSPKPVGCALARFFGGSLAC